MAISLDGQDPKKVWTTAATVDEALDQLAMTEAAPVAANRSSQVPLAGMALPVVSPKDVVIDDGGQVRTVPLAAPNVAALLGAADAPLHHRATVEPPASAPVPDGMPIPVPRVRAD